MQTSQSALAASEGYGNIPSDRARRGTGDASIPASRLDDLRFASAGLNPLRRPAVLTDAGGVHGVDGWVLCNGGLRTWSGRKQQP